MSAAPHVMFAVDCKSLPDSPRLRTTTLTVQEAQNDGTTTLGEAQEVRRIKNLQRGRAENRRRSTLSLQDSLALQPPKQFLSRDGVHYISPYPSPGILPASENATPTAESCSTLATGLQGYFDYRPATDNYQTYKVVKCQDGKVADGAAMKTSSSETSLKKANAGSRNVS